MIIRHWGAITLPLVAGALLACLGPLHSVAAQDAARGIDPGSHIKVSLVTVGPGRAAWERFGHNAIWVQDTLQGIDETYNYGMFSFRQESFVLRFIRGRMLYWMAGRDAASDIRGYIRSDRSILVQELNLTPAQRVELRDFLQWNARPENAYYRYHYYLDNCSTRIRDAIDKVTGGRVRLHTETKETGTTFRFHTQRLTAADPLLYTGLLMGLGAPVDRPISAWEEMFLPLAIPGYLREVTVVDSTGSEVPLVRSEEILYEGTMPPVSDAPPRWMFWYLLVGTSIAALLAVLGWLARRGRVFRGMFCGAALLWIVVVAVGGLVLAGLWALTDHNTSYWNENLFYFTPLAVPLVLLFPLSLYGVHGAKRPARWLGVALAASALAGVIVHVVPGFYQVNGQIVALALLPNVATGALIWQIAAVPQGEMVRSDEVATPRSPTVESVDQAPSR